MQLYIIFISYKKKLVYKNHMLSFQEFNAGKE